MLIANILSKIEKHTQFWLPTGTLDAIKIERRIEKSHTGKHSVKKNFP